MMIPEIDATILFNRDHPDYQSSLEQVRIGAEETGFLTLTGTALTDTDVTKTIDTYHSFFRLSDDIKAKYSMAKTGSNRGWGASGAEQVDPAANPDYKEVFDCGMELSDQDPLASHTYYAPNQWPDELPDFAVIIKRYYQQASEISLLLLSAVATAIGRPADYFVDKFDRPMALLRGNYYPPRPVNASEHDFGIAPHTDYGCLTLLATDGSPGLEVQNRDNRWIGITVQPGTFVINFGEMLQMWSEGQVLATPHRVVGGNTERISIPFFFNPRFDANVAPRGSGDITRAGDYLSMRYDQTYVHRRTSTR